MLVLFEQLHLKRADKHEWDKSKKALTSSHRQSPCSRLNPRERSVHNGSLIHCLFTVCLVPTKQVSCVSCNLQISTLCISPSWNLKGFVISWCPWTWHFCIKAEIVRLSHWTPLIRDVAVMNLYLLAVVGCLVLKLEPLTVC